MQSPRSLPPPGHFLRPQDTLKGIDPVTLSQVIAATADVALVLDEDGIIEDVAIGETPVPNFDFRTLIGRRWLETVTPDSHDKIRELLQEARQEMIARAREVNQRSGEGQSLPIRYSATHLGRTGRVLVIGRELRLIAQLQQQLVTAQNAVSREYAKLRSAETRYRMLFQIATEPVIIVEASSLRIQEANPAAGALLQTTERQLAGQPLERLFHAESWPRVESLLGQARVTGRGQASRLQLQPPSEKAHDVSVAVSLFRQEGAPLFLIRLSSGAEGQATKDTSSLVMEVLAGLPDAFVVIGDDLRVLSANLAFLEMAQLGAEQQVVRQSLDRWVGRPGVDLNIITASLKRDSMVRAFSTIVRGEFGSMTEVEVSAVAAQVGDRACYGLVLRPVLSRFADAPPPEGGLPLPGSPQQLRNLVGRVPMKDIIRDATDVIERLCIEAALEVSGDNRASAAQILGLSRQSLYAKMRRYGIGELDSTGE